MLASYPALFYYDPTETVPYFVTFPDFENSATQGDDISDALYMASDWLGLMLADYFTHHQVLPKPSDIKKLDLDKLNPYKDELDFDYSKSFISMVVVQLDDYLELDKPIKKTLTIPKWADDLGKELKINFSKTLAEAIADKQLKETGVK